MFVRSKGLRGRGEGQEAEKQRQEGCKGILTLGADIPISLLRSAMWDARNLRKDGRKCGAPFLKKERGDWGLVQSFHDRKGGSCIMMNGEYRSRNTWQHYGGTVNGRCVS